MSETNPTSSEEIRMGVANACLMMPKTAEKRAEEINRLYDLRDREKEAVAEAKEEIGLKGHEKRLTDVYGMSKPTLKIMGILDKVKAPGEVAAILTQVSVLSQSLSYMDRDLVSLAQDAEASAGQQADDQGSVFDRTSEGQRRGGSDAQPRPMEVKDDQPPPHKPTPGIPLHEAQAQLEAYLKANPPKRGAKPAERKRLEAQVEAAKAAEPETPAASESETGKEIEEAAETPAEPGEITDAIRAGNAEAEEHIREQSAKHAQEPPPAPQRAVRDLDDDLPPPAPRRAGHRGLGPDAIH